MAGTSKLTKVVSIRLPVDVYAILERRALALGRYNTVNSYLQRRLIYDITRKHGNGKRQKG